MTNTRNALCNASDFDISALKNKNEYPIYSLNNNGLLRQVENAEGSILYKLKTKSGNIVDVLYDVDGFPVFDKIYQMTLDTSDILKSRTTHFSNAGKNLYQAMLNDPSLMSKFTTFEIELFKRGLVPDKYTWHHHQDIGVMQLILKEVHEVASHTGGFSIWGKGN